jgi:hypothetical protein
LTYRHPQPELFSYVPSVNLKQNSNLSLSTEEKPTMYWKGKLKI